MAIIDQPGNGNMRLLGVVSVLLLAAVPIFTGDLYIRHLLIVAMMYAVVAASWDLSLGYAGVFNFAHVAFFALGAYTGGILTKSMGVSPWLAIAAGGVVASLAGLLVCLPVLRVKGIYVCLVTFAYGQLWLHLIRSQGEITGGSRGLVLIPPITAFGYSFEQDGKIAYYYLALLIMIVSVWVMKKAVNSYFGLSIVSLRDYEDYAVSRGVPLARQRLLTFALSAIFPGVVGAVYALYSEIASADLFGFSYTTTLLSMLILGGTATIYGPVIGAFVLGFASELLTDLGPLKYLIIAVAIILVLRFYPEGIYGGIKELTNSKNVTKGD